MATIGAGSNLTPEEAGEALRIADAEESATVNRPVPGWYFPVMAVLILVVFVLNSIEDPGPVLRWATIVLAVAIPLGLAVLVARVTLGQSGYHGVRNTQWPLSIVAIFVAGVLAIMPLVLAETVGYWIWIVCGTVLAGVVAGFGTVYWRRSARG